MAKKKSKKKKAKESNFTAEYNNLITIFIGIFLFREPFEWIQLIAFAIIWIGLVFFSYGEYKEVKMEKEEHNLLKDDKERA